MDLINYYRLCLLLTFFLAASQAIEIVSQSAESVLVAEGGESVLHCEGDISFDFCTWKLPSGLKCLLTAGSGDEECTEDSRFTVSIEENTCTLLLTDISRDTDVGDFQCVLTDATGDSDPGRATVSLEVAVQSQVHFSEDYNFVEPVPVEMDKGITVECHARGGWPQPDIRVALGPDEGIISPDDRYLMLAEGATDITENDDGTVDVANFFTFVPSMADCGKYVKCEAVQMDENGELLFDDGASVVSKKIMVTFPPQPLGDPIGPITFTPGEEDVEIEISFMANPVPLNHEAKWKIVPSEDTGVDPVDVYAGNDFFEKYSAASLNVSGHSVIASLTINNPTYADEDFAYGLEVSNGLGEAYYAFTLSTRALLITTPVPVPGEDGNPEAQEGGVSGGTIAAIVVVVLLVIIGLFLVFWAKKNNKWCFAQKDPVNGKGFSGDVEMAAGDQMLPEEVTEAPIIKSSARLPNNADAPQSDLERPDDSDSEDRARRASSHEEEQK